MFVYIQLCDLFNMKESLFDWNAVVLYWETVLFHQTA